MQHFVASLPSDLRREVYLTCERNILGISSLTFAVAQTVREVNFRNPFWIIKSINEIQNEKYEKYHENANVINDHEKQTNRRK
ncbi:hypothetical protein M0811_12783 [Anaeramoeba ignava]|uniref:Uncharacterized protein n=1 Tax=Anaeramoeba ignava TaxID=1746090 RepID=A0A9Q0LAS5_ANAIG|nr:hypothetical protein M0811_12783 [Anaeramoeba ignava]